MDQDKFLPHPLAWLRPEPCFMLYHTRPDERGAAAVSIRTGRACSVTDPTARGYWSEAVQALEIHEADGIGVVLYPDLGAWVLEVDRAFDAYGWTKIAQSLWDALPGVPCALASTGRGLHFFGRGRTAAFRSAAGVELRAHDWFTPLSGRFFDRGPVRPDASPAWIGAFLDADQAR